MARGRKIPEVSKTHVEAGVGDGGGDAAEGAGPPGKAKGIFPVRRALVLSRQESHCKFCFVSFFVREAGGSEMHARRIPMATAMFMTDRRGQGWARNDTAFGEYSGD